MAHPQTEALGELAELLGSTGLAVETARSTVEALNKLRGQPVHVIVSNHTTGTFDGVGLLEASVLHAPEALRIALVSSPDEAVELDYRPAHGGTIIRLVAKPSERSRLVALVGEGMKFLSLVEDQRDLVRKLSLDQSKLQRRETLLDVVVRERTKELEESYEKLKAANRQALFGLERILVVWLGAGLATLVLGGIGVALLVFGGPLENYLRDLLGAGIFVDWFWTTVRWVLALLAVVTLFALFLATRALARR